MSLYAIEAGRMMIAGGIVLAILLIGLVIENYLDK